MRGLDPRIFLQRREMAGSSPAMTTSPYTNPRAFSSSLI
jgi:hypothetical protein